MIYDGPIDVDFRNKDTIAFCIRIISTYLAIVRLHKYPFLPIAIGECLQQVKTVDWLKSMPIIAMAWWFKHAVSLFLLF